jgi:hypothetical protein
MASLLPGWCLKARGFARGGTWRKQWTRQSFLPKRRGPGTKTLPSLDAGSPFRGIQGKNETSREYVASRRTECGRKSVGERQSVDSGGRALPRATGTLVSDPACRDRLNCGRSRPPKATQSQHKATPKPTARQPIGNPKPPPCDPKAPSKPPTSEGRRQNVECRKAEETHPMPPSTINSPNHQPPHRLPHATWTHLRSRAALYIASITVTRAAASRGGTRGWSLDPATASTN